MSADIELSPEVIEIIENYLGYNHSSNHPGMERFCQEELKAMCYKVFDDKCVNGHLKIHIKGKPFQMNEYDMLYDRYFHGQSVYQFTYERKSGYGYRYFLQCRCERYFSKNAHSILMNYINDEYKDLETAILDSNSFVELFEGFLMWFEDRRKEFMEKMGIDIDKVKKVTLSGSGKPQSHGGVANLLKVLTKTMEKQGSDITNIAKVQYAVCVQAGIYIPDEFIRDVAIALNISEVKSAEN